MARMHYSHGHQIIFHLPFLNWTEEFKQQPRFILQKSVNGFFMPYFVFSVLSSVARLCPGWINLGLVVPDALAGGSWWPGGATFQISGV